MKDKFYPHAILYHPSISDEEVWDLIFWAQARFQTKGPVVLLIEPSETLKGGHSSPKPWQVSGKPVGPTYH